MPEGINSNNSINDSYKYQNQELSKYDADNDGCLSAFEFDNIQDETDIELLAQEYGLLEEEQASAGDLDTKLNEAQNNQGIVGKLWNGIKNITGLGTSTKKCEQAIADYKSGDISYEEADEIISSFSSKQESSVNLFANIATGVTSTLVVGSAVLTGGLSLGVIAAAAGAGALTKAGLKFADRATNKVKGDAADAKQIIKDSVSGAVDGAISAATMGMGTTAVTCKTAATQTMKQTIIQGAKAGAIEGGISGAVTGAADYTIEAALEEDVEFNVADLAKTTAETAIGGVVAGGIMGGAASGIQYKGKSAITKELEQQADELNKVYEANIDEAKQQIQKEFGGLKSIEENGITGRAKSKESIFEKLYKKFDKKKLASTSTDDCLEAIGDAYGTRIQIKSLTKEKAQEIIEDCLDGSGISYNQFISYMQDASSVDDVTKESLDGIKDTIIDLLKEEQTQEVVDQLIEAIGNGRLTITELNNYGNSISSYFTDYQLQEISDAFYIQTGEKLKIVTHSDFTNGAGTKYDLDNTFEYFADVTTDGATKESGYASTQMNTKQPLDNDSIIGNGELQIRGSKLNKFADAEHIPYDIRTGKITAKNKEYADIFSVIDKMSDGTYKKYNEYLNKTYEYLRLEELGIPTTKPDIQVELADCGLTKEAFDLLSMEGLIEISKRAH